MARRDIAYQTVWQRFDLHFRSFSTLNRYLGIDTVGKEEK